MIEVRYIDSDDASFWFSLDHHLTQKEFQNKIETKRGYVLLVDGEAIGLLRYNLFFDEIPFCTMLIISEMYQKQGYGKRLLTHWEKEMQDKGYQMVMTSTQADEQGQHFYRKLGYKDCGGITFDFQPLEIILSKKI